MYIAVDLGATNLKVGIGDTTILEKVTTRTPLTPTQVIAQMKTMIDTLLTKHQTHLQGIGIASIGPINQKEGTVFNTPNLPFQKLALSNPLTKKYRVPVFLLNDGNAAVFAESQVGPHRGIQNLVYVTLSTGIGGGAIVNGTLLQGKDGNAVEIGHMVIDSAKQLKCGCGKYGHWEAYCSGANIPKFAQNLRSQLSLNDSLLFTSKLTFDTIDTQTIFERAHQNDPVALQIVEAVGKLNAIGFANLTNLYDPEVITIGGGIAINHPKIVLNPIRKHIKQFTINRIPKIALTQLRDDVCLMGALLWANQHS
ncbi:MAG: ROK family protein [Candidatus Hermodarchaeia archaeon]|jgi:glucokinase